MQPVQKLADISPSVYQERIESIAQEILDALSIIAVKAEDELTGLSTRGPVQISNNTFNTQSSNNSVLSGEAGRAERNLRELTTSNREGYETLAREPALARVVVEREDGKEATYYFCRKGSLTGLGLTLAPLLGPTGSLASQRIGEEFLLPNGQNVTILENTRFRPKKIQQEWDGDKAEIRGEGYTKTVDSLRALLAPLGIEEEDVLTALLSAESASENLIEGIRRSVITRMDLRDQPVLDQYQDKIFRLPLDSQLMILGAPGTGKTTTLIRRLGQKTDADFLDDDEKRLLVLTDSEKGHANNWIMFTPTELLKLYVKEAFSREGIPASDDRISTWMDFREKLARNEFPILKTPTSNGWFVMKDTALTLMSATEDNLVGLFEDFDQWQRDEFWKELHADASRLAENNTDVVAGIGKNVLSAIEGVSPKTTSSTISSLAALSLGIKEVIDAHRKETDKQIEEMLRLQVNRNRSFLNEFRTFMEGLPQTDDDIDDQDSDDENETQPSLARIDLHATAARYRSASRTYARARYHGKHLPKNSSTGRIVEWLGERIISEEVAKEIGKSLVVQSALKRLLSPVRGYIDKIPTRYRRFRKARQSEGRWYSKEAFLPTDAHPLEVDIILLAMLRNTDSLIEQISNPNDETKKTLDRLQALYYTQVLVDEVTDFSPIQLACMATLSRPRIRSFFACGDFNQRFTSCGIKSLEQVRWAVRDIEVERISVAYRQSSQLHSLAQQIIDLSGEDVGNVHLSEDFADNEGFAPVLVEGIDGEARAAWLAERIMEIQRSVHELPSIAILVNDEDSVRSVADSLKRAVEDQNIQVIPCPDGQVRGRDSAVRVFNVQHIKGLEFEAVFFIDIDKLAEEHPDLFEKYLYVGATRAATYFGVTCKEGMPSKLSSIRGLFKESWS